MSDLRMVFAAVVAFVLTACGQDAPPAEPVAEQPLADMIITGQNLITMDEQNAQADAVAVIGDTIAAVGSAGEIMAMRGSATRVIELGDRALVPGFVDAHGHIAFSARLIDMVNLSSPPVGPVETIDDVVELLRNHIAEQNIPPDQWVFGYGYDDSLIAENRHPDRDDLDRASSDHPIALMHVSGHLAAVNSTALAVRDVTAESADPPGGVIRRREGSREPNGVLEETAAMAFTMGSWSQTEDELISALKRTAAAYAAYGITTAQDGGATMPDVAAMRAAAAQEPFPIDIVAFPVAIRVDENALESVASEPYQGGFRIGGVKLMLDGSPQGRTAYLSQPYTEGPPGADPDYRAYPNYPAELYEPMVAGLIDRKVPVLVHANGDAAIDMMIAGVNKAIADGPVPDHRTVIIHAQLLRNDQLADVKRLGLVPSFFAAHSFFWGDWHVVSFGEDRGTYISPAKDTLDAGIPFTIHNDAPVVPPDMMRLIWAAVNRKTRSDRVIRPDQRLTPSQALHAVTLGAAYQYFEEETKGSITQGKQADLVILGANPLTVEPDAIKDIAVLETFARGKSVYRASL